MTDYFQYPIDASALLRKKKAIRRDLLNRSDFIERRIAILGGSTTAEIRDMLELFLLHDGIKPVFYESDYNRYFEDIMFPDNGLKDFQPHIIFIHTTSVNITRFPALHENSEDVDRLLSSETGRFFSLWDRIATDYSCPVIQNNFELPHYRLLGNLDAYDIHGRSRFIGYLNLRFSEEARRRKNLFLNDINYLSAWFGLEHWHDRLFWYSFKYALSYDAIPFLANSVATIIKAIYGRTKKCLALDLDNTIWGGVIGDEGLQEIRIGKETPESEAYSEFQEYIKGLKERGIILAICSKNDEENAREGFMHQDNILSLEDFAVFRANWKPKHENIRDIANALNISMESVVFADDNPVEREIVRVQEPDVIVPELGSNVVKYIDILDKTGLFETITLSVDDLQRSLFYTGNNERKKQQECFENYGDFLRSLEMVAEIRPFSPVYLDRIAQLTNKTNQFNLTTRRYTLTEIQSITDNDHYITLYGRLSDKFGDNGLVSVMVGEKKRNELHINLWLMSCRVLKRGMESAMLDRFVAEAMTCGISHIVGYYFPTAKNGMVSGLFEEFGFQKVNSNKKDASIWRLDITDGYSLKNNFIQVNS
ncbi:MAG: HAD-IIIC family phosphatase [Chlorobiaceae bacterium]|nr:HAD-IIIC family phosphatase [Chlorobiaceae bacterium]